jgi:hypothetical protein
MKVTEFGIVIFDKDEHLEKQLSSMEVIEFGIVILDKDEHLEKQ